jgi:hypothetical protein
MTLGQESGSHMNKLLVAFSFFTALSAQAAPQFDNLSKEDVKDVVREFGANFSHTVVSAPETNGLWGVEVGIIAGRTSTPDLKRIVEDSGGNGSDVENLYHAGVIGRAHFPLEIFAEINLLPEQEFDDISVQNKSFGLGWNPGRFFGLPLDIAVGIGKAYGEMTFSQTSPTASTITLKTATTNYWVGVSKTFLFITPYLKVGTSSVEGDLTGTASIFGYTASTKQHVESMSGNFLTAGANFKLALLNLGLETSQVMDVKRVTGKISFGF